VICLKIDLWKVTSRGKYEMRLDHKAGIDIIYELALRLYPSSLESFREAISNSLDEGSKKVEIQASRKEVCVEDWGEGIQDLEKFRTFGDYTKSKRGGETIGMKGLGKLSLLRMGKNVKFKTNNGKFGIEIDMTPEYLDANMGAKEEYLQHQGTRVEIFNPAEVPSNNEIDDYLKRAFGLRIASGVEITLNGISLTSKVDKKDSCLESRVELMSQEMSNKRKKVMALWIFTSSMSLLVQS
jgi:hypothetical protein